MKLRITEKQFKKNLKQGRATNIDGRMYYTVEEFGRIVGKCASRIYVYINQGVVKSERLLKKHMIPVNEVFSCVFTVSGRRDNMSKSYKFTRAGAIKIL